MTTRRPPSAWADAEREFHLAYDEDPMPFPRQPVTVAWRTRGDLDPVPAPDPLWEGAPAGLDRRSPRAAAIGPFTIADDPAPLRRKGTTKGTLVGELGTNAVCCIEVDGQILWPTMPPVERSTNQP